jgi:hypothetical protein
MESLFSRSYLQFGCRVKRRQFGTEPGDREVGWVAGGSLDGLRTLVMWGRGPRRKMEFLPTSELEQLSGKEH